jgi:hypothetical protein
MVDNNNSNINVPAPHVAHELSINQVPIVSVLQHPLLMSAIENDSPVIVGGMHA